MRTSRRCSSSRPALPGSSWSPRTRTSTKGSWCADAENLVFPRRAAGGARARVPRARGRARHAAAGEPGDPRARAGGPARLLQQLEQALPARWARPLGQGAVPRLRVQDDRVPLLRVPTVSPGGRARARRGGLPGAARVRALGALRRPPEGGAALHEHARVEPGGRGRGRVGRSASPLQRGADRRARLLRGADLRAAALDQDARDRARRGARPHAGGAGAMSGDDVRAKVPDALSAHELTRETVLAGNELVALCARALAGEDVEPRSERERAALDWTYSIEFDSDAADDDLWRRLHEHFSEPELVELGYGIAYTLGQQHWQATLGLTPDGERELS